MFGRPDVKIALKGGVVATLLLGAVALAGADGNPGPNLAQEARMSYAVGPYSRVETLWGGLTTTIPVVSLKGPGGTLMAMNLIHRSNTSSGSYYNGTLGSPGAGWTHDVGGYIYQGSAPDGSSSMVQSTGNPLGAGGLPLEQWRIQTITSGGTTTVTYPKRPGTRSGLTPLYSDNQLSGWRVTSIDGRMSWNYTERVQAGQANITLNSFRLTSVSDTHGNAVTYRYNPDGAINTVTDAAGRTLTFGYFKPLSTWLMSSVTLTTADGARTWDLEHTDPIGGHQDWLTAVRPPKPDASFSARPGIDFGYDGTVSLTDVRDLRGNLWHYDYVVNGNIVPGGTRVVSAAYPPKIGGARDQFGGMYDATLPTTFSYVRNIPNGERTCSITDSYMAPTFSGLHDNGYVSKTRTREYVYEDIDGTSSPGNPWFRNPIKRVVDPYVAGGNKYWETFGWDYSQANLTGRSDKDGRAWTYTYLTAGANDNSGLLWQIRDYNGVLRATYGYNTDGRLTAGLTAVVNDSTSGLRYTCTRHGYDSATGDETSTIIDAASDGFGWTKPSGQPARSITTTRTFWPSGDLKTEIVSGDATGSSYSDYVAGQPKTVTTPAEGPPPSPTTPGVTRKPSRTPCRTWRAPSSPGPTTPGTVRPR